MKYLPPISLACALSILGCERVSNSYSPMAMECGISSIGPEIALVNVPGQTGDSMSALLLTPEKPATLLDVTSKGCVLVPRSADPRSEVLFKSKREGLRFAEVLPYGEVLQRKSVTLYDLSGHKVKMGCQHPASPGKPLVNTRNIFEIWGEVKAKDDGESSPVRHFDFEYKFESASGAPQAWSGNLESISTEKIEEGTHGFQLVARFKAYPELSFTQDCSITKDTTPPLVELPYSARHYKNLDPAVIQVLPAENLSLKVEEKHAFFLQACWQEHPGSAECHLEPVGTSILAPSRGSWVLHVRAEDEAGNAQIAKWPLVVYEKDKIHAIMQSALSTQLLAESNRWLDGLKLITRTAAEWIEMPHSEQLQDIERQLKAAFIRLFFDQEPSLIVFENKHNVEYMGEDRFLYFETISFIDREILKLEVHDYSAQPAAHFYKEIERPRELGEPVRMHSLENQTYILIRVSANVWKVLDFHLNEMKTIHAPMARKEDFLQYFPDFDLALLTVGNQYYPLSPNGMISTASYSLYDDVRRSGVSLYSLQQGLVWNPQGETLFNGPNVAKKILELSFADKHETGSMLSAFSCNSNKTCEVQLIYPELAPIHLSMAIKISYKNLSSAKLSRDRRWLVYNLDAQTIGLCSFTSGECSERTFPSKVLDTCFDLQNHEFAILTLDNLFKGQSLENMYESTVYTGRFRTEFGRCQSTERGIALTSFDAALALFDGKVTNYKSEVNFTYDGSYALEAGLNSSQVRVLSTLKQLYDTQIFSATSMIPEKHYFSVNGNLLVSIGDSTSVFDLSQGLQLTTLENAMQEAGMVLKVLSSQRDDELIVQFRDKVSKFNIFNNQESIIYKSAVSLLDSANYRDGYLLVGTSEFVHLKKDGTSQILSQYFLPADQGEPLCTTFSDDFNAAYFLDSKGFLIQVDIHSGYILRARLDPHPVYSYPVLQNCKLYWNESDATLYIANESSYLWKWKESDGDRAHFAVMEYGAELSALNSTASGRIVVIGHDMAYDKVRVYDPTTELVSHIGMGIDIRGGWIDNKSKTAYLAGFNGEVIAMNPDLEGRSAILWKIETGRNLHSIHVAEDERSLAIRTYEGELLSLKLDLKSLLQKSCAWLGEAAALDAEMEALCRKSFQ